MPSLKPAANRAVDSSDDADDANDGTPVDDAMFDTAATLGGGAVATSLAVADGGHRLLADVRFDFAGNSTLTIGLFRLRYRLERDLSASVIRSGFLAGVRRASNRW